MKWNVIFKTSKIELSFEVRTFSYLLKFTLSQSSTLSDYKCICIQKRNKINPIEPIEILYEWKSGAKIAIFRIKNVIEWEKNYVFVAKWCNFCTKWILCVSSHFKTASFCVYHMHIRIIFIGLIYFIIFWYWKYAINGFNQSKLV